MDWTLKPCWPSLSKEVPCDGVMCVGSVQRRPCIVALSRLEWLKIVKSASAIGRDRKLATDRGRRRSDILCGIFLRPRPSSVRPRSKG